MVPRDAHLLDLVFSDVQGGEGTYDNRGGLVRGRKGAAVGGGLGCSVAQFNISSISKA